MVARAFGVTHLADAANKADKLLFIGIAESALRAAQSENNFRCATEVPGIVGEPSFREFQTEAAKGNLSRTKHGNFSFRHPVVDPCNGIGKTAVDRVLVGKL